MSNRRFEETFDTSLKDVMVGHADQPCPMKEVVICQLMEPMQKQSWSRARLADMLKTSRSQVDRLLDPTYGVTFSTRQRVAALVGCQVQIELV